MFLSRGTRWSRPAALVGGVAVPTTWSIGRRTRAHGRLTLGEVAMRKQSGHQRAACDRCDVRRTRRRIGFSDIPDALRSAEGMRRVGRPPLGDELASSLRSASMRECSISSARKHAGAAWGTRPLSTKSWLGTSARTSRNNDEPLAVMRHLVEAAPASVFDLAIRQTLTDGPELAGSGPADADLRSGASETGFSACSRRRPPVRGEMLFPARCGSAWPQP